MESRRPLIAEIKRNSLDDGPGIRSVVFFKGCPLSCVWCHNPECIDAGQELIHRASTCITCDSCITACAPGAITSAGPSAADRTICTFCGDCVDECPTGSLSILGRYYGVDELVEILARDKAFYDNSGGGVTLSGGEPTLAMDYASEVAKKLRASGIRVCLETCADFDWDRFSDKLLPNVDLIYCDVKLLDSAGHRKYTGRDNSRILRNAERLVTLSSPPVLVRVPLIPGITTTSDNLSAIATWCKKQGITRIALLPYNPLWISKARGLGKTPGYDRQEWMSAEDRDQVKKIFRSFEIEREI